VSTQPRLAPLPSRPRWENVDGAGKSGLSPGLISILARMAEAVLDAEDAVASGGNMPDRRDLPPQGSIAIADGKRLTAKETRP